MAVTNNTQIDINLGSIVSETDNLFVVYLLLNSWPLVCVPENEPI